MDRRGIHQFCSMVIPPFLVFTGIFVWRRGYHSARFFLPAWSIFLSLSIVVGLNLFGIPPGHFLTLHGLRIGLIFQVVLLSFALGDRINLLRKQDFAAQQQASEAQRSFAVQLESKISEKTAELQDANRKLEALSSRDGLTGLRNRRYFDETIQTEWRRLVRDGRPLSLIMGDSDFFKKYNDF